MAYKNNEYAYRILLEFNRGLEDFPDNLKDAFVVRANEYDYVGGDINSVNYEVVDVYRPQAVIISNNINLDNIDLRDILITDNGLLQLQPVDGGGL